MAQYGQVFNDKAEARLLPPESSEVSVVAREVGIGEGTLQRWLDTPATAWTLVWMRRFTHWTPRPSSCAGPFRLGTLPLDQSDGEDAPLAAPARSYSGFRPHQRRQDAGPGSARYPAHRAWRLLREG